jgi:hypothetical protein
MAMNRYQLSFDDLVSGLEFFGDQYGGYEALDVFTRDLQKVGRTLLKRRSGEPWPVQGEPAFVFERDGRAYKLRFHPLGIARLTRTRLDSIGPVEPQAELGLLSFSLRTTILNRSLPAAVIGFLVGERLGDSSHVFRRVFTMSFDPLVKKWGAFDGSLLELVREKRQEAEEAFCSAG